MKILVMGTGGVGGFFGGKLANAGYDVRFIARGKHLEAMKKDGLKIISETGNFTVHPVNTSDKPQDFDKPDIILLCVKSYDIQSACNLLKPIIKESTTIIPFLNGMSHIEIMKQTLGKDNVLGGVAAISALIKEPGTIIHNSPMQMLKFGELNNNNHKGIDFLHNACTEAGINNSKSSSIYEDMWQKTALMCSLAGVNCLTRLPLGPCRNNAATRELLEDIVKEVILVAKAEGANLPENQFEVTMKQLDSLPEKMKASTLPALEKGEKLEVSALHGTIAKLGMKHHISTPMNKVVYAALAPHENGSDSI